MFDLKMVSPNDHSFLWADTITEEKVQNLHLGKLSAFNLDFNIVKSILNCNQDEKIRTPCLKNYANNLNTNVNKIVDTYSHIENLKLMGPFNFVAETKCEKPCQFMKYETTEMVSAKMKLFSKMEPFLVYIQNKNLDQENMSAIMISHFKSQKIKVKFEEYQYSIIDFIGDAGGTIGVFIGASFLSLYQDVIETFIKKFFNTRYFKQ